ncbi:MAG TPA: RES family NAD+ phosphorylase [Gaiellaceae bacterium]|nr:RES family NAD+ phosphorylase [Gaiellaceae bacterium]
MPHEPLTTWFEGHTFFRYSSYDTPFWARMNKSAGRWHQIGSHATQYLSVDPDGAWAELIRHEGLRTEEEVDLVRIQMWAAIVRQANLVDYSTFENAERSGFSPAALIDDDWGTCQAEGERLRSLGYAGVVAPSAALPGAINVTLFGSRMRATWTHEPQLASAIPACVVAVGSPPPGLVARVRQFGDSHTGYDAYLDRAAESGRAESVERDPREEFESRVRELLPEEDQEQS